MANLAVFASGDGSNFESIAAALRGTKHSCPILVCDRKNAFVLERAKRLGIPSLYVPYPGRPREEAEAEIRAAMDACDIDVIALAGFMRLLSPGFVDAWENRLLNVHPSILPRYPGVDSIRRAYDAGETEFGLTIHFVDAGMDSGDVILQKSFHKNPKDTLETVETTVHSLEHRYYPETILTFLDEWES